MVTRCVDTLEGLSRIWDEVSALRKKTEIYAAALQSSGDVRGPAKARFQALATEAGVQLKHLALTLEKIPNFLKPGESIKDTVQRELPNHPLPAERRMYAELSTSLGEIYRIYYQAIARLCLEAQRRTPLPVDP